MTIMSKRGNLDNVVTYEHICDTTADMQKIDSKYITLGSTCIVISGDTGGMEVYLADSNKTWSPLGMISGGGGGGDGGGSSGSGITVIECEITHDYNTNTTTLTHADQLKAALDDMAENPTHGFNYALCLHEGAIHMLGFAYVWNNNNSRSSAATGSQFCFATIGAEFIAVRLDDAVGVGTSETSRYIFQSTDIDENGTARLTKVSLDDGR